MSILILCVSFSVGIVLGFAAALFIGAGCISVAKEQCDHDWKKVRTVSEKYHGGDVGEFEVYQCSKCKATKKVRLW